MFEAVCLINALQNASGSIKKQEVLRFGSENENFRKLLYYALNPMLTYKISEQRLRTPVVYDPAITLTMVDIFDICECLSKRKALDDATVYQVCVFVQNMCPPNEMELYTKLLSKTLRLGVTAKTVNKVIPGLIPEWEVQQAYPIESHPIKDGTWFSLTQKLNGVRATYYKGRLYARSGIPYGGLDHITDVLSLEGNSYVFDGELTLLDKGSLSDNEAFRVATGIVNSDAPYKTQICYTIFDLIPVKQFEADDGKGFSYRQRRSGLDGFGQYLGECNAVKVLPVLYQGTDQSKIPELLEQMVREDKEGLMVNLDVPYKRKRHNGILKVKRFYTMDLPIIGWERGAGRLSETLGALVLDYKSFEVKVGSGFSDEQRTAFWADRENLIGKLCEVKYKEVSRDKATGAESLQFPVFVAIRTDKNDVNYDL